MSGHELTQPELRAYAVPPECVTLVNTAAAAARFSGVLHELLHAPATVVGIDLEWRPDTLHAVHRPSLLQLAISTHVWLVDLDAAASCTPALLDAVAAVLTSSEHRILGFGLQVDLDRLQSVCRRGDAPLIARSVVDLRDACLCGTPLSSEAGLAAQLRAWTGKSLDKAMQCSDWAARPLSATQIAYAAADAMSLVELDRAIASWVSGGQPPDEPRDDPRLECTLVARCASERTGRFRAPAKHNEDEDADADEDEAEREERQQAGDEGLRLVRAALDSLPCAHAADCWLADSPGANAAEGPTEINALCFTAGDRELGQVLVLVPALAPKVDLRWLALALNCPKRKLRLASDDECVSDFGAIPGRVPPLPLRPGTRVLCDPRLCDAAEIWGSSCDARQRIFIRKPRVTLPALAAAATAAAAAATAAGVAGGTARGDSHPATAGGGAGTGMLAASTFEWLPSPDRWHPQLDDALDVLGTKGLRGASLIVDPTLSVLARKLRMLGIDCLVAGEVLRADTPTRLPLDIPRMHREAVREAEPLYREGEGMPCEGEGEGGRGEPGHRRRDGRAPVGLLRVCIEGGAVATHHRLAALEGRLLITTARHVKQPAPCAAYRLLATSDASRQLAEVPTVLQLRDAAERKDDASRCGICNGDAWQRLQPSDVQGTEVPPSVLQKQTLFYRCGVCSQIFWPRGDRPRRTRHGCKGGVRRAAHAIAGTDRVACAPAEWRPSSQLVMALGAKSKSGGQMLLEARGLHAALRAQLEGPRAAVLVGAVYHY